MGREYNMNEILSASLGEIGGDIKVSFKKTVMVKQYEPEVIEVTATLSLDKEVSGIERTLLTALLQSQVEYEAYIQLLKKNLVSSELFTLRKTDLELGINAIAEKYESLTGESCDRYFSIGAR